jgi:hypothetical protein
VGKRWRHLWVRVVGLAGVTHIYFGEELIRSLVIDPELTYQPSTAGHRPAHTDNSGRSRQRKQPRQV